MPEFKEPQKIDSGPILVDPGKSDFKGSEITESDIIIHIMPKRFLNAEATANKAKGIGLLILLGGGLVLVFSAVFLYFYLRDANLFSSDRLDVVRSEKLPPETAAPAAEPADVEKEKKEKEFNEQNNAQEFTAGIPVPNMQPDADTPPREITISEEIIATSSEQFSDGADNLTAAAGTTTVNLITPADSDQDGLYDSEEGIFGSRSNLRDSDNDNYEDLTEVLSLYNPVGAGSIYSNSNINKYTNGQFGYTLYHPASWRVEKVGGDDSVIFNTGNNQFVQVIIAEKADKQNELVDWYKENARVDYIINDQILFKKGWEGIKSPDGLNIYLTKPNFNYIIVVTYNLGGGNRLDYKNIFQMMVNSLEINP